MDLLTKAIAFASGYWLASCNGCDLFDNDYIDLDKTPFDAYYGPNAQDDDLVEVHTFTLSDYDGVFHQHRDYKILGRVHTTDDIRGLTALYLQDEADDTLYIIDPHTCEIVETLLGDSA